MFCQSINASKLTKRKHNMRRNTNSAILLHFKEKQYEELLKEKIRQNERLACWDIKIYKLKSRTTELELQVSEYKTELVSQAVDT